MTERRDNPYLWVTWITGLMAGEAQCQWAAWFRAHFKGFDKRPSTLDMVAWKAQHGEMLRAKAAALRNDGYTVFIEEQNKFTFRGQAATLQGKPDVVAVKDDDALVVDCKTGQRRDSDILQMLVYMLVLPHTHSACSNRQLRGEIEYRDGALAVPTDRLTAEIRSLIRTTIERAAGKQPTPRVPSAMECRFCDIMKQDCPERIDEEPPIRQTTHDLF